MLDVNKLTSDENRAAPSGGTTNRWFYFRKVGDIIAGTLVNQYTKPNSGYKDNDPQTVYDIDAQVVVMDGQMLEPGIYSYGSKAFVNKEFRDGTPKAPGPVKIGQVIALKFTDIGEAKPGLKAPHYITLYSEGEMGTVGSNQAPATVPVTPVTPVTQTPMAPPPPVAPTAPVMTTGDKVAKISEIVKTKFNAKSPEEVKALVVEKTSFEFNEKNLDAILTVLALL